MKRWIVLLLCVMSLSSAHAAPASVKGDADAEVTLLVFSAFTCPYCAEGAKQLAQLEKKYPGRLRIVFKHFPLGLNADALLPHMAAAAAGEQGRFWAMHDRLFAEPRSGMTVPRAEAIAKELGLDVPRFAQALQEGLRRDDIDRDLAEAKALNVRATPTYYIEGFRLEGLQDMATFERIIDHRLARSAPPTTVSTLSRAP